MNDLPQPDTAENRLKVTLFVVEANSFEQLCLWRDHASSSPDRPKNFAPMKWEQIGPGWSITVGSLGKRECFISLSWVRIEGQLVMFWYPQSEVSDTRKSEKWINAHFSGTYDNDSRPAKCDAMNFGHCLRAIHERNKLLPTVPVEL